MKRRRAYRIAVVLAGLAASLVFGYLAVRGVRFHATWHALQESNGWWIFPALGALTASMAVRVVRWRLLFRPGRRPPFVPLAKASVLGLFFNSILPARAGEAARIVALRSYAGTPVAETTATVVVERIADVTSLLLLLFLLVAWLPHVSWLSAAGIVAACFLAGVIALGLVVRRLRMRPLPRMRRLSGVPGLSEERLRHAMENALHGLETLVSPRQAVAVLVWTYGSWFLLGLSFWFLMLGMHLHLSILAALLVVIATGLAFIVPSAPSAIGVFEAAGLTALSAYGIDRSHAFAYVVVLHLLNFVPFVAAGLVVIARDVGRTRPVGAAVVTVRSRR